jgi:hypothetical protein
MGLRIDGGSFASLASDIARAIQQATWQIAEEERARAVSQDGFDSRAIVVTDGVKGKAIQDVKPFGKIVFVADTNVADAVLWALAKLIEISPVGPAEGGHYKDEHIVRIDGEPITGNLRVALTNLPPGSRVDIVNPRIYARKLEGATANQRTTRARAKRKALSRQAPNGVYRVVLRLLVQRYSKSMFFDFKYVKLPNTGYKVYGDVGGGNVKINGRWVARAPRARALRDQVFPAIQFFKKSDDSSLSG